MRVQKSNKLEEKVFRSYWNDGLVDVLSGVALLAIGIGWAFDQVVLATAVPPLLVPLWKPLRQHLVEPRLGYVEFTDERTRRNRSSLSLMNFISVLVFIAGLVLFFRFRAIAGEFGAAALVPGLPVVLLAFAAVLAAKMLSLRRFLLYAAILAFLGFITVILQWTPDIPMLIGGIAVSISGLLHLFRFIRRFPRMRGSYDA